MDDYYNENEKIEEVIQWELDAINNYIVSVENRSKKLSKDEKSTIKKMKIVAEYLIARLNQNIAVDISAENQTIHQLVYSGATSVGGAVPLIGDAPPPSLSCTSAPGSSRPGAAGTGLAPTEPNPSAPGPID